MDKRGILLLSTMNLHIKLQNQTAIQQNHILNLNNSVIPTFITNTLIPMDQKGKLLLSTMNLHFKIK